MTRYIDADKLKEDILDYNSWYLYNEFGSTTEFHELIDKAPTADVVEVVRCKDCRHANECHKSVQYTRIELNSITIGYSPIEWCSKGERREP